MTKISDSSAPPKSRKTTIAKTSEAPSEQSLDVLRPGLEIRILRNMTNRYLTATRPQEADTATGGNTPILMFLVKHRGEEIFQYDIEKRFGIARSTASRVLGLMEKKGLIERQAVERDARLRRIVLTEKALPITQVLYESASQMEQIMLKGLSTRDQRKLLGYLTTMKNNLINTGELGDSYKDCGDPLRMNLKNMEEEGRSEK